MRRTSATLLLTAALLLALAARAGAEAALWVAADQAPVRIWRSAEAEVLLRLPRGAVVTPLGSHGAWTKIQEPGGTQGWMFQAHLSAAPLAPALGSLFEPAPPTMILAEAADTARSNRSQAPPLPRGAESLELALSLRLGPDDLDAFLAQGGIGEFARVRRQTSGGPASFPPLRPLSAPGGEDERQLGLNLAARVLGGMAAPDLDAARLRYVNLVGLAVARYAPGQSPRFRAVVLDLPRPVSFSLPGGLVMLSTGLLNALENEAQLALILAHETAHASLGHLWAEALETPFFRKGGRVDEAGVRRPEFAVLLDGLLNLALVRGLDREPEFDADSAAVMMAFRAGYDPQQLPRAIERIEAAGRASPHRSPPRVWADLHPPTAERLARIRALLKALPEQDGLAIGTERYRVSH